MTAEDLAVLNTLRDLIAKNATDEPLCWYSDGRPKMSAPTAANHTEFVGVRVRGLIFAHSCDPGTAPSRENA